MKLSQDRIEKIIRYLDLGRYWARHAIEWCDCVEEALKELESFRRSARDGCFGLNWESALEEIAKNNQLAAHAKNLLQTGTDRNKLAEPKFSPIFLVEF